MPDRVVAGQIAELQASLGAFLQLVLGSPWAIAKQRGEPIAADFVGGNPQELALPEFVAALTRWSVPQHKDWFAYQAPDRTAQVAAAASLSSRLGMQFDPDDIVLTRGSLAGLVLALRAVLDPGDEVIFMSPPYFFYRAMITIAGGRPVVAQLDRTSWDLDLDSVAATITERTRALIVNSPNNPTGKIATTETLEGLAELLRSAGRSNGRPVYLLSDEAYSRILFDGNAFHSPGEFYPWSVLVQTYSKTALAPSEKLGYLALPPTMPDREIVRGALAVVQLADGWAVPNAVMQYALPDIDAMSIDLAHLQEKRDRVVDGLRGHGYELTVPEATFYVLVRSPIPDDWAFTELLASRGVFIMPGSLVELPGYFRISLTATMDMIDYALPVFGEVRRELTGTAG